MKKKEYDNLQNDSQRENTLIFYQNNSLLLFLRKCLEISSDFVTNSYAESWDSSCEKSRVSVQNHWVPVQKHESLGLYVTTQ